MAHRHELSQEAQDHLQWISDKIKNTGYTFGGIHRLGGVSYYDCMMNLYTTSKQINDDAMRWYDVDKLEYEKSIQRRKAHDSKIARRIGAQVEIKPLFITLGFNHQTWSIKKCLDVIQTITTLGWVESCRAVFEYHRENGLHPHCHIYIEPNEKLSKTKVLEKLWAAKGIKKVMLANNGKYASTFLDYKEAQACHIEYIMLRKKESKMVYVERDTEWREKNGIPILEKNWKHI